MRSILYVCVAALLTLFAGSNIHAQTESTNPLAPEIFKQLIEINTTDSVGNVTTAAEAMAARLREAGFADKDVIIAGPADRKKNLVARIHSTGKRKPIL